MVFEGSRARCTALFDSGSGITAIRRGFFEENFGARWSRLGKPIRVFWINGASIAVDKYAQVLLVVDGVEMPETVFVVDDFVEEVGGRRVELPELIVGSGTMDKYGIALDPREGVRVAGASLMI